MPLIVSAHPRARRITLRFDDKAQLLKLTRPRSVSERRALEWARGQHVWIERQLAERGEASTAAPGDTILFDGVPHRLEADPARSRGVVVEDGAIRVGGPPDLFARRLGRWLRDEARRRLTDESHELAARAGVRLAGVQVGDAATRWGSCSRDGRIRYSWRLILAPPEVRRYVVAHEIAHRLHMDHSPAFKAAEREILGEDPRPYRLALRRLSADLRRVRLP